MRMIVPLTGTVLVEGSLWGDGSLTGDDNDPIRPIDLNLGYVSYVLVDIDLDAEVAIIEVEPAGEIEELTGELDAEGEPKTRIRRATRAEKTGFLRYAQQLIEGHTKDGLFQMTGNSRLRRPFAGRER